MWTLNRIQPQTHTVIGAVGFLCIYHDNGVNTPYFVVREQVYSVMLLQIIYLTLAVLNCMLLAVIYGFVGLIYRT